MKDLPVFPHSYKDYRSNEDYSLTHQFWLILAVRFAFVILFEVRCDQDPSKVMLKQTSVCVLLVKQAHSVSTLSFLSKNRSCYC